MNLVAIWWLESGSVALPQVLVRMRQFKDDLLVSCLQLLLSLPNQLVQPEFPNLVPALQVYIILKSIGTVYT